MPSVAQMFREVLALQQEFSSANTPAMATRGALIRNEIPAAIREWRAARMEAVFPFRGRLNVQGRDGTGLKTLVPWVRIHSPELSPSAQRGWYVVYLFKEDGSGVTLGISHGSTRFDGGDFKPRSPAEAAALMSWGRQQIGTEARALGFVDGVDLGSSAKLATAYERTTAFSKVYPAAALPDDETLQRDALQAVSLLGLLYRAIELGRAPESDPPELQRATDSIEAIARPRGSVPSGGQGFGLSHEERCLIEERAMHVAHDWLVREGFTNIRDVSSNQSCDFIAEKAGADYVVEVKGTTSLGEKILLTANEVELHRKSYPLNLLIVVHSIELHDARKQALGGDISVWIPWDLPELILTPLSYSCRLERNL